jgi:predicted nucleic acid-binding Zn ribbon protein
MYRPPHKMVCGKPVNKGQQTLKQRQRTLPKVRRTYCAIAV